MFFPTVYYCTKIPRFRKTCPLIEKEKCTPQHVVTVEMNVKYHSNQKKTDLFIAENASKIIDLHQDKVAVDLVEDLEVDLVRRDDRPREMHDAKCGDCGTDCQVPFKPKEDRPVYCRECFQNHRN